MTNGFCTTILTFALRPTTLFMCQLLTLRSNRRRRWLFVQRCSLCNINYGSLILRFNHRSRVFIFVACRSPILIPIFHQRRRQPNKVRHGFGHRRKRPSSTTSAWVEDNNHMAQHHLRPDRGNGLQRPGLRLPSGPCRRHRRSLWPSIIFGPTRRLRPAHAAPPACAIPSAHCEGGLLRHQVCQQPEPSPANNQKCLGLLGFDPRSWASEKAKPTRRATSCSCYLCPRLYDKVKYLRSTALSPRRWILL